MWCGGGEVVDTRRAGGAGSWRGVEYRQARTWCCRPSLVCVKTGRRAALLSICPDFDYSEHKHSVLRQIRKKFLGSEDTRQFVRLFSMVERCCVSNSCRSHRKGTSRYGGAMWWLEVPCTLFACPVLRSSTYHRMYGVVAGQAELQLQRQMELVGQCYESIKQANHNTKSYQKKE
jgi:hypothetical protein